MNSNKLCLVISTALPLFLVTPFAHADTAFDIEYLPSGDYENAIGFGIYNYQVNLIGFYTNIQSTIREREPKYDSLNIASFGDPVTGRYQEISIFNIGITKGLTSNLGAYLGIGYTWVTGMAEKYDPMHILSGNGYYYVEDPANDDSGANLNAGLLFGKEKFVFNLGYHSFTSSAYIGFGVRY